MYIHIIYVYSCILFCIREIFIPQNEILNGVIFYILVSFVMFAQKIIKFVLYFMQLYSCDLKIHGEFDFA